MHRTHIPDWAIARGKAVYDFQAIDPAKTAVLAIDLQKYFIADGEPMANPHAQDILPAINRINATAREAGVPIIFTQHSTVEPESAEDMPSPARLSADFIANLRTKLAPGSPGFDLHPALDLAPEDTIIVKYRASALHPHAQTDLHRKLRARGVDTLIITGLVTNGCCETTAREAHAYHYKVIFASDATAAMTDDEHNAALLNLRVFFADVQSTAEIQALIERSHSSSDI